MSEKENIGNFDRGLLTRYLNNETTPQENTEVEIWINQSDENRREMEACRKMLNKIDNFYKAKSFNTNAAWNNVHSKIDPAQLKVIKRKKKRKEKIAQFYKYAAILVVALLLGSVGYYIGFKDKTPETITRIASAEKQILNEFVLPDGSVVTLNSNSELQFPKQFSGNTREVTIVGEAFFRVKPNPEKPFIINAGGTQVKVLGTSFNVCAYPETKTVEVVVKTGKVQVVSKNGELPDATNKVFLVKGEKGTLYNNSKLLEKSVNTNPNFLAWKTKDLIFNETPLKEVIHCLEKVYHIEIQLAEPDLENLQLTAHFDKKPINFVLDVIRLTFNLKLTGENEHFKLSGRTQEQALKS